MKTRLLSTLLAAAAVIVAALTALTIPATAQTISVRLPSGEIVEVDVPPGTSIDDIQLPGTPVTPTTPAPAPPEAPAPAPKPEPGAPSAGGGSQQNQSSSGERVRREREKERELTGGTEGPAEDETSQEGPQARSRRQLRASQLRRHADGRQPRLRRCAAGPSTAAGVPNFIIRKFRVPPFLLPIYQAAGIEYGVRWEILAAINEIETDYGRNLNVSSAGALGWMQFMPPTWAAYGVDANKDGRKDPYNPVDAIFAAAKYLKAANYENDVRAAIWAYNHADWYVDSVLLRARLIAGVPADLIGSLTGLTEGRFPVYARARYADDLAEQQLLKRVKSGENAAQVIESSETRRSVDIFSTTGAPVVAVNDGKIKEVGRNKKLGRYVVLQDVYGNRYTYAQLGAVSRYYPVPKRNASDPATSARALKANGDDHEALPKPQAPASAGHQIDASDKKPAKDRGAPSQRMRAGPACRSSSACSRTPTWTARATPAASSSSWTPRPARTAPTRSTRTTSRGPSASTRRRSRCAASRSARA